MIGQFSGLCFIVRPAKFKTYFKLKASLSSWTQRYDNYLNNPVSSVCTVSDGKDSVCNLRGYRNFQPITRKQFFGAGYRKVRVIR